MALKDAVISLVLRAKNAISKEADPAADSLREVTEKAEELEKELQDLGKQQDAVRGLKASEEAAEAATKELEKHVTAYERLRKEGRQAGQSQAQYALEVRRARTAQSIATTEYNRSQRELAKYSRTLDKAGIDTNELGQAEDRIQKELKQTQQELNEATEEAKQHAAALDRASGEGNRFGSAMSGLKGKLLGLVAGVGVFQTLRAGITKLVTAGSDLEELERQFGALYGSLEQGRQVLAEIDRIAERNSQSLGDTAEAARRLKVAGIDPLNGSLQSLIDANAKYGSGAQTLDTVITQLGQAWQSGRLQLEELNSITDSGIPIMEALGNVTGRAGGEIRQMASDGLLGKEVLSQLIDELGRMSEGAGADRISGFAGLVASLRKEFTDFFALAAKSGALDSLKNRMEELLTTLREAAADGSINTFAKNVSAALESVITVTGKAVSAARIGVNIITGLWRGAATSITASAGAVASGLSTLLGALGSDELAADLRAFSERAKQASHDFADGVKQDYQDIQNAGAELFSGLSDNAQAAAESQKSASNDVAEAVDKDYDSIVEAAVLAGKKQTQALEGVARAARSEIGEALEELGLDFGKLTTGISKVEQEAISSFASVVNQVEAVGLESEKTAEVVAKAFSAAFGKLESKEAHVALLRELDQAMQANVITQQQLTKARNEANRVTLDRLQKAIQITKETTQIALEGEEQKQKAAQETAQAYQQQGQAAKDVGSSAQQGASQGAAAASGLQGWFYSLRGELYAVSDAAGQMFDKLYGQKQGVIMSTRSFIRAVVGAHDEVSSAVEKAQYSYAKALEAQSESLGSFIAIGGRARWAASLLGDEKLTSLNRALESAKQQMEGLRQSASGTVDNLRIELANLRGDTELVEKMRYEQEQERLRQQRKDAWDQGAKGAAKEYNDAIDLNRQIYELKQQQRKEAQYEADATERQKRFDRISEKNREAASQQDQKTPTQRLELALQDKGNATLEGSPDDVNKLMEFLAQAGMRSAQ